MSTRLFVYIVNYSSPMPSGKMVYIIISAVRVSILNRDETV